MYLEDLSEGGKAWICCSIHSPLRGEVPDSKTVASWPKQESLPLRLGPGFRQIHSLFLNSRFRRDRDHDIGQPSSGVSQLLVSILVAWLGQLKEFGVACAASYFGGCGM
jgi:hypothetical protein